MDDEEEFESWVLGPLFQMTSLILHEQRAHLSYMNAIGELCAQFTKGILAFIRNYGADRAIAIVEKYHQKHPAAAQSCWYPDVFAKMDTPEWEQLYVNAEHDGQVGLITISRESLNWDVINELNRAIDWLKREGIDSVIITGDFHLSTQMVGADTTEFFPALSDKNKGYKVALNWSKAARRLNDEFKTSVGFINGKRCLGGMMELMMHCHYIIALDSARLGMPEVTLPVVPGMEGCHWAIRKTDPANYGKVFNLLLTGKSVKAKEVEGWLIDFAGSMEDCLKKAWALASGKDSTPKRKLTESAVKLSAGIPDQPPAGNPLMEAGRKAIFDCIKASCAVPLSQAIEVQAKHSAGFMTTKSCQKGVIGGSYKKMMAV